jgi:hypothetical protein
MQCPHCPTDSPHGGVEWVHTAWARGTASSYGSILDLIPRSKRHLLVDTLGLLLAVLMTDGVAAPLLLGQVHPYHFPRLVTIFANQKYHNHALDAWMTEQRPGWRIEVRVIQFSVVCSIPPLQRGARGDLPALGVPKSPHPPLRKGERNEN